MTLATLGNYVPANFPNISDPRAVGKFVSAELDKISIAMALANQQIAAHEAAWTPFTAALTVDLGVISQVSASSFLKVGKTVFVQISELLTVSSGVPTQIQITLPVVPLRPLSLIGRVGPNRIIVSARFVSVAQSSIIRKTDGTTFTPTTTDLYEFFGTYESV